MMLDFAKLTDVSNLIASAALTISIVALIYTIRTYLLKSGQNIKCSYNTMSTVQADDMYIVNLTLENIKDRATVIFAIYLKIGRNNYLEIEDFSSSPLILKPFEVYHKTYDPVTFYSEGMDMVKIDHLLSPKVRKKIILSTTNGKFVVKSVIKQWSPISNFFRNYYTSIIRAYRLDFENTSYGGNTLYLVSLEHTEKSREVIPIYDHNDRIPVFKDFALTKDSLGSTDNLKKYLQLQKRRKKLRYKTLEIIDYGEFLKKEKVHYRNRGEELQLYGFFEYNVLGRMRSIFENLKSDFKNGKLRKANRKRGIS